MTTPIVEEEKYRDVASVVKLKESHPTMNTQAILDMLKEILFNCNGSGDDKPELVTKEQPALPETIHPAQPSTYKMGRPKSYNKHFELIGQRVKDTGRTSIYTDNPFGVKVQHFTRCEKPNCGMVGVVNFAIHGSKHKNSIRCYLYKEWTHDAGNKHYVPIYAFDRMVTWPDILKMHSKGELKPFAN